VRSTSRGPPRALASTEITLFSKAAASRAALSEASVERKYVSVAEAGLQDQYRRALIGVGLVAADRAHLVDVLAAVERFVAARPELELLSARQREVRSDD
jgi:uncharacterized protein YlxP (DUF503 family)